VATRHPTEPGHPNGVARSAAAAADADVRPGLHLPFDPSRYVTGLLIIATVAAASFLATTLWRAWGSASKAEVQETVAPIHKRLDAVEGKVDDVAKGVNALMDRGGVTP
jgi:hypothetical protein